eukprot:TRINITY_DN30318_c0_g1_i1.p1 TRINITY_DN30318_c0_g1~~TRINITY_DN30318_c0_g1_i1.p1  ORF type:complete len:334 (-),score=41.00 TRINITY_DN30318_c0_g1_i1:144-1145(-)
MELPVSARMWALAVPIVSFYASGGVEAAGAIDLEGGWSVCDCPDMSQWLPILTDVATHAADGLAAGIRAMEENPGATASKKFRTWLTKEVPCNPLPFQGLNYGWTIPDYRFGKQYMLWDPHIRGDDYLGAKPKQASAALCFPGRMLVHLLCSQKAILEVDMGAFASHLQAVQDYSGYANDILSGDAYAYNQDVLTVSGMSKEDGWTGCASWTAWQNVFVHRPAMEKYVKRMLTERIPWPPKPGYSHLLAFEPALRYQKRVQIHPLWRVCAPLKEKACFPAFAVDFSCFSCCDIRQGPRGKESCWSGPYTWETCCQRDFRDEHKRTHCIATGEC